MTTLSSSLSSGIYITTAGPYSTPFAITSSGTIAAQAGYTALYAGSNTTIDNAGLIVGGAAEPFFDGIGTLYNAGAGFSFSQNAAVDITNAGTILGGVGYHLITSDGDNTGGIGFIITGGFTASNTGLIAGGTGGTSADGGIGLVLTNDAAGLLTNAGTILGGNGGGGGQAGFGGVGAVIGDARAVLVNTGLIAGGNAGTGTAIPSLAAYGIGNADLPVGTGVVLRAGVTLVNAGTIAAGAVPNGIATPDAVELSAAGTLIADPGAVFTGAVAAAGVVGDVLQLAGYGGTLAGLGSQFTGFTTIGFAPGATGLIAGDSAALAAGQRLENFSFGDSIDVTGFAATGAYFGAGNNLVLTNATAHATLSLASEPGIGIITRGTDGNGGTEIRVVGLHHFYGSLGSVLTIAPDALDQSAFTIAAGATVNAAGNIGTYASDLLRNGATVITVSAAVFGPAIAPVTLTNSGLVTSSGSYGAAARDYGVFLGAAGTITNAGTIQGAGGIGIFATAGSAAINNTGLLTASSHDAVQLALPSGTVLNAGTIAGAYTGLNLYGLASVTNSLTGLILTENPLGGTAIFLKSGGTLRNDGTIIGGAGAIVSTSYAGITNGASGVINSYQGILVYSTTTNTSTISNAGTITAGYDGITVQSTAMVSNTGTISSAGGPLVFGGGVIIAAGTVSNSGTIITPGYDIRLQTGTVFNTGTVSSMGEPAINVFTGSIFNSGLVVGSDGEFLENSGAITNAGTVMAVNFALYAAGGSIANSGFAGGSFGVFLRNSGVVTNAGTLSGTSKAVYFYSGRDNTLIADPGAVFIGKVDGGDSIGGTGISLLELAAGTLAGTLAGVGSQFYNFQTLDFAHGATWSIAGDVAGLADGQTIAGFSAGDTIVLDSFAATSQTLGAGGLTLANATATETLDITGISQFFIADNAGGGTDITTDIACFVRGTRMATPRGNIPIEKLNIGDLIRTMHGDQPIRWIGRRAYAGRFIAGNSGARPIRIRRHAIALNIPSRDLYVSPDHALCEGGVLIHAHLLQNGISIHQPARNTDIEYFHLEFDTHTILFAENLSVESFIDEGAGNRFQNSHTRPLTTNTPKPCLPRLAEGFHLHNIKSRIAARAGIQAPTTLGALHGVIDEATPTLIRGWAQNSAAPEHPVTLEIISGTYRQTCLANAYRPDLRAAGLGSGCHGFQLTLPYLQHPVTIRRIPDGALLPPPQPRHARTPRHASESWHPRLS